MLTVDRVFPISSMPSSSAIELPKSQMLTPPSDTITSSSSCLLGIPVSESLASCCVLPMTHTPSPTSLRSVLISYVGQILG